MESRGKKAAAILDYILLIFIVVMVLYTMSIYIKRGVMGKWKEAGDMFGHGRQYEGEFNYTYDPNPWQQ